MMTIYGLHMQWFQTLVMVVVAKTIPSGTSTALSGINTAIVQGNYEDFMLGNSNFRFNPIIDYSPFLFFKNN